MILSLIWLSQILRIIDIKYSIANQLLDILFATFLILPTFLNPLMPLILIMGFMFFNYSICSKSEHLIINQYLNKQEKFIQTFILIFTFIVFYFFNNEIISPKLYNIYKQHEVKIRNNFKLGIPANNELHISDELSIFFTSSKDDIFFGVNAILFKDNQFVEAELASIEYNQSGFNIVFVNGQRVKMNINEKSKTIFEKFIYNIHNENIEVVLEDKEHLNTFQLLNHNQKDFNIHGHNRIYQYILIVFILIISPLPLFHNHLKTAGLLNKTFNFTYLIIIYLINSYLIYKLNLNEINLVVYYSINVLSLVVYLILNTFKK